MLTERVEVPALEQRVYLNAFPKAGTHLAELFVRRIAAPIEEMRWAGTFGGNSWSTEWAEAEMFRRKLDAIPAGGYVKGHAGYRREFAELLWDNCVASIFVYRNLRDVVISQAHHIMDTEQDDNGDVLRHPGKDAFADLPFEEVVIGCICGHAGFPGIAERWRLYAPWLDEEWVLKVTYEQMRDEPWDTGSRIMRYVVGQSVAFYGQHARINRAQHDEVVSEMVELSEHTETVTYRRGVAGGWRDEWTPAIERAWRESGAQQENEALGYE